MWVVWRYMSPAKVFFPRKRIYRWSGHGETISNGGRIFWPLPSLMDFLLWVFVEVEVYQLRHQEMWGKQTALLKLPQMSHPTQECGKILLEIWGTGTEGTENLDFSRKMKWTVRWRFYNPALSSNITGLWCKEKWVAGNVIGIGEIKLCTKL
jgi:hypothetical protein